MLDNIMFQLRRDGKVQPLVISPQNLAALSIGATVVVNGEKHKVKEIVVYLGLTEVNAYMTMSDPILELEKL